MMTQLLEASKSSRKAMDTSFKFLMEEEGDEQSQQLYFEDMISSLKLSNQYYNEAVASNECGHVRKNRIDPADRRFIDSVIENYPFLHIPSCFEEFMGA